jgi:hypothetical protein
MTGDVTQYGKQLELLCDLPKVLATSFFGEKNAGASPQAG